MDLDGQRKKEIFIKVKSYACRFLNETTDEHAETDRLSDADPIPHEPKKYGSLQLHNQPQCGLKSLKKTLMFPSLTMKLPIHRFYARLLVLTSK